MRNPAYHGTSDGWSSEPQAAFMAGQPEREVLPQCWQEVLDHMHQQQQAVHELATRLSRMGDVLLGENPKLEGNQKEPSKPRQFGGIYGEIEDRMSGLDLALQRLAGKISRFDGVL